MKKKIIILSAILGILLVLLIKVLQLRSASIASPSGRYNIAVYNPEAGIWVLALDKEDIAGIFLPKSLYIKSAKGAGDYQISKLDRLAQFQDGGKDQFIIDSISLSLYLPIDYLVYSDKAKSTEELGFDIRLYPELNILDRINIWKRMRRVSVYINNIVDLTQTLSTESIEQADGVVIRKINPDLFPVTLRQKFVEEDIAREEKKVVVANTTNLANLANIVSNLIESVGIDVVRIENADAKSIGCQVRADSKSSDSMSIERIKQITGCKEVDLELGYSGSNIEVYIGRNFGERMLGAVN